MVVFDAYVQQCADRHALVLGTRASAKQMEQAVMSLTSHNALLAWKEPWPCPLDSQDVVTLHHIPVLEPDQPEGTGPLFATNSCPERSSTS